MDGVAAALIGVGGVILLQTLAGIFYLGRLSQRTDHAAQEAGEARRLLVRHLEAHGMDPGGEDDPSAGSGCPA